MTKRFASRLFIAFLLGFAVTFIGAPAHAQGHGADEHAAAPAAQEHGDGHAAVSNPVAFRIVPFIAAIVVFGFAFEVLRRKAWPLIVKGLSDREEKIRTEIEDAERARKQANAALQQYERALAEARTEAGKIIDATKLDAIKLAGELRSKTEADISALRDRAQRDIEAAKTAAISEIYTTMATTATAVASKILERELNAEDQQRLVDDSLNEFQSVARA